MSRATADSYSRTSRRSARADAFQAICRGMSPGRYSRRWCGCSPCARVRGESPSPQCFGQRRRIRIRAPGRPAAGYRAQPAPGTRQARAAAACSGAAGPAPASRAACVGRSSATSASSSASQVEIAIARRRTAVAGPDARERRRASKRSFSAQHLAGEHRIGVDRLQADAGQDQVRVHQAVVGDAGEQEAPAAAPDCCCS